ncbi:MAG: hypothetical protein PVS3B3_04640 [Ktedonobacteraceae bacterium]
MKKYLSQKHLIPHGWLVPFKKLWLAWDAIQQDTTLTYSLGKNATTWGSGQGDAPPSYSV